MTRTLLALLTLALAAPAIAQEAPAAPDDTAPTPPADDPDVAPPPGVEEIVVTATRNRENLQDVPGSVATLYDEKLSVVTAAGADLRFISARVPSVTAESSFGRVFPRFYIRGLGNTDFDLNASQPVSLVYDGVVLENPMLKGFPVFDLDRIEVLRGPQGTLFGRNTPAGVIKLESKRPGDVLDAFVRQAYGRFNLIDTEAAVGGPIVEDILSGRLSILFQQRDDYVDNDRTPADADLEGFRDFAARGQLLLTVRDFQALVNVHGRTLDGTARVFRANAIETGGGPSDSFDRYTVSHDGLNEQTLDSYGAMLELTQAIGDRMEIVAITGYEHAEGSSRGDIDGGFGAAFLPELPMGPGVIPFPSESADAVPGLDQISQEVRFAARDMGPIGFQVGGFFFYEDLDIESFSYDTLAEGRPQNGYAFQSQQTTALAAFGSLTYRIIEPLEARAGVRYSRDTKEFTARRDQSPLGAVPLPATSTTLEGDFVSWDASLTYAISDDINVYARVARGFRAPSIQGRVLFGDVISTADSERILSYEAGVKSRLFAGALTANLTGYYFTLDDQQLTAVGGAGNFNTLINADQTIGYGFELDLAAAPARGLFVTAGLSLNHTEIDDPDLTIVGGAAEGLTFLDPVVDAETNRVDIDGNPLPHAPAWIANLTARYGFGVGPGEIFAFGDVAWRSAVNFFLYESEEFRDEGLLEVGLRAGYAWQAGLFELEGALYGRNLLDDTSFTGGVDFNNRAGFINEPRTWGVELSARF